MENSNNNSRNNSSSASSILIEALTKAVEFYIHYIMKSGARKTAKACGAAIQMIIVVIFSCALVLLTWIGLQIIIFLIMNSAGVQPIINVAILTIINFLLFIITLIYFGKFKHRLVSNL